MIDKSKVFAAVLSIVLLIALSGCETEDFATLYRDKTEIDGFYILINQSANCCFVGQYNCTAYTENMEITIPDEYDGMPVTRLGGYCGRGLPTPFQISLADLYMNAPEGSKYNTVSSSNTIDAENCVVEDVVFILNIGENIKTIEYVTMDNYYPHINEDDSITYYHPVVKINCSDSNKHFYSKDGKLYYKNTDELVSDFAYAASE